MPRQLHNALTPLAVKSAKPGRHADGGGLYLLVKESGARSWLFRAMIAGKRRDIGLGSAGGAGAIPLAKARELARLKAAEAASGEIPVSDRRRRKREAKAAEQAARIAGTTFRDVAQSYIAMNESGWKNDKHRAQWRSTMASYAYPHFGDLPVAEIGTEHIIAALKPIWTEKPETASRVRGRIENILDAAKVEGLREGENPARWRGHLDKVLPNAAKAKKRRNAELNRSGHHPALPYADTPRFMDRLASREGIAARALEFTILTAARTGETQGATWGEVDLDAGLWTIPAARMKAEAAHTEPLSPRAIAILREMKPLADAWGSNADRPLFPAPRGGALSNMAMAATLRRMHESELAAGRTGFLDREDHLVTVHGFRSSFRDWASECTSFPHEVCEMALAHTIGNRAEAAYRRGALLPKRRKLMEAWADYCSGHGNAGADGNVTPIRRETAA